MNSIILMEKKVECCFTSTETVGLLGTGALDGHLDFHTTVLSSETTLKSGFTFKVLYQT